MKNILATFFHWSILVLNFFFTQDLQLDLGEAFFPSVRNWPNLFLFLKDIHRPKSRRSAKSLEIFSQTCQIHHLRFEIKCCFIESSTIFMGWVNLTDEWTKAESKYIASQFLTKFKFHFRVPEILVSPFEHPKGRLKVRRYHYLWSWTAIIVLLFYVDHLNVLVVKADDSHWLQAILSRHGD